MAARTSSPAKGFLAGALGGAIGTLVLNAFQQLSLIGTRRAERALHTDLTYTGQQQELMDQFEEAHTKTAETLAHAAGTSLSPAHHAKSAAVTEYAFGILCAGIYGALAEDLPAVTAGFGSVYGAVLFTGASEFVLPAIRFVPTPGKRTPVQHLGGLAGNIVYGLTTEAVRRLLRD